MHHPRRAMLAATAMALACTGTTGIAKADTGPDTVSAATTATTLAAPADTQPPVDPRTPVPVPGSSDQTAAAIAVSALHQGRDPLSPNQSLVREFGIIGLTAEMNSDEHFGALQARLGAYTALSATDTHPDLSLQNIVVPAHALFSLDTAGHWFFKVGAAQIKNWADDHGADLENTSTTTALAQIQYRPRPGTLIGLGGTYESNIIHLAGGGRIVVPGPGIRFDLLQRIGSRIGFAAKVLWMDGTTTTTIPLGGGTNLVAQQSSPRTYIQLGLIGMIGHKDTPLVPEGWSLRPTAHLILQRTAVGATTTNLGSVESRQLQDYGEVLVSARLQKEEFRSAHPAPFVELGAEIRIDSTIPTPASNPTLAYAKAGATMRVGNWGFFDAYYAYRDSFDGTYRSGTAEILLSATY